MSEDCYIYWDGEDVPENDRRIYIQCVKCYAKNKKGVIWHAAQGYKNKVVCGCGRVIHQGDNDQSEQTTTTV